MEWSTHTHALLSRKLTRSKLSIQQLHEQRDQLRMHVRDTENRHDALLQNRDKARQALERSKQAANRPRQDLHTSELNALASSIALEKNTLEDARRDLTDINQKLVKAMDDHAGLELEVSKAGLSDAITQRKSTLATKAEERRARETGIQETATRALATRSLETVGSGVEHLAVSAPGTKPADLIAQATKEKRQAGLAREAEEMQAAEDKKVRDVLDFQSNMDEQKKILAEQTRLRAQRRKREEQHEDLERTELAKQGINVLSETCRAKNKLEREANEKKFALEQEHKKMELSRTLEQQRAVLQQRSATASKPQWHDRADIKASTFLPSERLGYFSSDKLTATSVDDAKDNSSDSANEDAKQTGRGKPGQQGSGKRAGKASTQETDGSPTGQLTGDVGDYVDIDEESVSGTGHTRTMEKFEASNAARMQRAFNQMKQYTPTEQHAAGRIYRGPGFAWKPERLVFQDFNVGKEYSQRIVLTNISLSRNACKLISVTPEIFHFVTVEFSPSGMISAGTTCAGMVTFQPKMSKDLTGEILFHSETGPFAIPVLCRIKRRVVTCDAPVLDFGKLVVSEKRTRVLTLHNTGALNASYRIRAIGARDTTSAREETQNRPRESPAAPDLPSCAPSGAVDHTAVPEDETMDDNVSHKTSAPTSSASTVASNSSKASKKSKSSKSLKSSMASAAQQEQTRSKVSLAGSKAATVEEKEVADTDEAMVTVSQPALDDHQQMPMVDNGDGDGVDDLEEMEGDTQVVLDENDWQGTIPARGKKQISISMCPVVAEDILQQYRVQLVDSNVPEILVEAHAVVSSLPVYLDRDELDLRICSVDFLYQDDVIIYNRTSASCQFRITFPEELKHHLVILPLKGVVQANSKFSVWIKFSPTRSLLNGKGMCPLSFPVNFKINDLSQQLLLNVKALVTDTGLTFSVNSVDFGRCSIQTRKVVSIRLNNGSSIVQPYGFVGLPKYLQVEPLNGFGELPPGEGRTIHLIFAPENPGEFNFTVNCQTLQGRVASVDCKAVTFLSPLKLSHSLVEFDPTPPGNSASATITVSNPILPPSSFDVLSGRAPKRGPRHFSIAIPEGVDIEAYPVTGVIHPGEELKVKLIYAPRLDQDVVGLALEEKNKEVDEHNKKVKEALKVSANRLTASTASSKVRASKTSTINAASSARATPKTMPYATREDIEADHELIMQVKNRCLGDIKISPELAEISCYVSELKKPGSGEEDLRVNPADTLYIHAVIASRAPASLLSCERIDFKQVASGSTASQEIEIENISNKNTSIRSYSMDPNGPYTVEQAGAEIAPLQCGKLRLRFSPRSKGTYSEVVEFRDSLGKHRVRITGECVEPAYHIQTADADGLNFKERLVGVKEKRQLMVHNTGSVLLDFEARLEPTDASQSIGLPKTTTNMPIFRCVAMAGKLSAGEKCPVVVEMMSDRPILNATARLLIRLSSSVVSYKVCANVWQYPICLVSSTGALRTDAHADTIAHMPVPRPEPSECTLKANFPMTLSLDYTHGGGGDLSDYCTSHQLTVQSIKQSTSSSSKDNKKSTGEFVFGAVEPCSLSNMVIVDPAKGPCDKTVTIKLKVPDAMLSDELIELVLPLTLKYEGTQKVNVVMRSKYFDPDAERRKKKTAAKSPKKKRTVHR